MRLLIATDEHYISDGINIYSSQGTSPYRFWCEYLEVFEQVLVFARLRRDQSFVGRPEAVANGPNVEFFGVPDFTGPFQYVRVRSVLSRLAREAVSQADAYFVRVPGPIGSIAAKAVHRAGRAYAAQVVGDPWDVFGAGAVGGMLRPIYRRVLTRDLKSVCRNAGALWYVTQRSLQRRYPASDAAFVSAWSDVQIGDAFASDDELGARLQSIAKLGTRPKVLGWVGTLQASYKRADILLKAAAICSRRGLNLRVRFAGDGRLRPEYERLAAELGIADRVEFVGQLGTGAPIYQFLDSLDLFVMPSPAEGLPRAMIEAMARGCPCIGCNAGGIPELLEENALVKPADPVALADKIAGKLGRPEELARMVTRNREEARRYSPETLVATRAAFLRAVRDRVHVSA